MDNCDTACPLKTTNTQLGTYIVIAKHVSDTVECKIEREERERED